MTDIAPTPGTVLLPDDSYVAPRGAWAATVRFLRRQPVGMIGIVLVAIFGFAGLFADWIAPYNPTANDFTAMTEAPSWVHLLGTDQLGRDILSRILFGARTAFIVGITSAVVGGLMNPASLVLGAALLPAMLIGNWLGDRLFDRSSAKAYRPVVVVLLAGLGVVAVARGLIG